MTWKLNHTNTFVVLWIYQLMQKVLAFCKDIPFYFIVSTSMLLPEHWNSISCIQPAAQGRRLSPLQNCFYALVISAMICKVTEFIFHEHSVFMETIYSVIYCLKHTFGITWNIRLHHSLCKYHNKITKSFKIMNTFTFVLLKWQAQVTHLLCFQCCCILYKLTLNV